MNEADYVRRWGRRLACQEALFEATTTLATWALVPLGLAAVVVVWATTRSEDTDTPC